MMGLPRYLCHSRLDKTQVASLQLGRKAFDHITCKGRHVRSIRIHRLLLGSNALQNAQLVLLDLLELSGVVTVPLNLIEASVLLLDDNVLHSKSKFNASSSFLLNDLIICY